MDIKDAQVTDWRREHPLVGLDLNRVFVAAALRLRTPADWQSLVRCKDGDLIVAHRAGAKREIVIGFDVLQSNWPFEVSFPIFLDRSIAWLSDADSPAAGPSSDKHRSKSPDGTVAGSPATAPTTRHASAFQANCVLSALADGKRQVLASPSLNLDDGGEAGFLFTGKPPVIVQPTPGTEAGTFSTVRLERQPDGRFRIRCRLKERKERAGDQLAGEESLLPVHEEQLAELRKRLMDSKLLLDRSRELDSGEPAAPPPYTAAEISPVDARLAAKLNAAELQEMRYQALLSNFGRNYPPVLEVERSIQLLKQDIADSVDRFNRDFMIVRGDAKTLLVVPRSLSKLQAIVDSDQRAYDAELNAVKDLRRARGVQTDQTVKPGEPVAVELGDGTRLVVTARRADR